MHLLEHLRKSRDASGGGFQPLTDTPTKGFMHTVDQVLPLIAF